MKKSEMELMLKGYGLTTAQIFYRMPDFNELLQSFTWQEYDIAPDFPRMRKFLKFWEEKLDGPIHSVQFAHRRLVKAGEWQNTQGEFLLN